MLEIEVLQSFCISICYSDASIGLIWSSNSLNFKYNLCLVFHPLISLSGTILKYIILKLELVDYLSVILKRKKLRLGAVF